MKHLVIFDTNGLLHRAFHALPRMTDQEGRPTNALYGFSSMLVKALQELKPDYAAGAYDTPEATFRHKEYAAYKETRAETPEELSPQLELSQKIFRAFGIMTFSKPGYEADDIVGTLARRFAGSDIRVTIVTGDLDTLQLVDESISVLTMKKGVSETTRYTPQEVRERYSLAPTSLPDYKGLVGDTSDNIPGVQGVGEKTAKELFQTYASLEEIYAAVERNDVPERIARKLRGQKEQALFSRELATIVTTIELPVRLEDLAYRGADIDAVEQVFSEFGFQSLVARVKTRGGEENDHPRVTELLGADDTFQAARRIFFLMDEPRVYLARDAKGVQYADAAAILRLPPQAEKIGIGVKEAYKLAYRAGINPGERFFDVRLAGWLLRSNLTKPTPERLIRTFLGRQIDDAPHAVALFGELAEKERGGIAEYGLERLFTEVEMPLLRVLAKMEYAGIRLNPEKIRDAKNILSGELAAQEKLIHDIAGTRMNVGSPQQLRWLLFEKLKLTPGKMRKTKTGVLSTEESELMKLKEQHPVIEMILKWRALAKLISTYTDTLTEKIDPATGRIHPVFEETGTVTGRVTSEDPALQNLPREGDLANLILDAFEADPGYVFIAFDYSQIELRIAAHLSGDESLRNIFLNDEDIHTYVAQAVFGSAKERRKAKVLNFGILYGMGPKSLSELTGFSQQDAKRYIEQYFARFPAVRKYRDDVLEKAKRFGYAETILGRKRFLPELAGWGYREQRQAEREAINFPVQGTGADILKQAMLASDRAFERDFPSVVRLVLAVHDELVFEVREDAVQRVTDTITYSMEHAAELSVPLRVHAQSGKTLTICRK